jgi:predicted nucleic acid-binding protein
MIVVSDTSAITSLMQIGQVALLRELHGKVLIPRRFITN